MKVTVGDIIGIMESLAPAAYAENWDNSGLQIGHRDKEVRRIWVSLDPSMPVIESACRHHVDLLITHHPLIFKPLRSIDLNAPVGKIVSLAIENKLAVFSAHTNLDAANRGINEILAERIGLKGIEVLGAPSGIDEVGAGDANIGLGRIGKLEETMDLGTFAESLKSRLGLNAVRVAGNKELLVDRIAVCCGSGSSLLPLFFSSAAQVFVSGDLKYHDARDAEALERGLIDIGHFASEHLMLTDLVDLLNEQVGKFEAGVLIEACTLETDPFIIY